MLDGAKDKVLFTVHDICPPTLLPLSSSRACVPLTSFLTTLASLEQLDTPWILPLQSFMLIVLSSPNVQRPTWLTPLRLSIVTSSKKSCLTAQYKTAPHHLSLQSIILCPLSLLHFSSQYLSLSDILYIYLFICILAVPYHMPLQCKLHERKNFLCIWFSDVFPAPRTVLSTLEAQYTLVKWMDEWLWTTYFQRWPPTER